VVLKTSRQKYHNQ